MVKLLVSLMSVTLVFSSFNEDPSLNYISQYKEIAIAEMHRTGIPASIKMAQALLESGAGRSSLANEANNHFGIKCGGSWNGETYFLHDDDYNSRGVLIKSCFRQFNSPLESFIEHSNFLKTQNRYAFLFDIDHRDYYAWAKGLKAAGYATDKAYSQKLINIIEKYQLYMLDEEMLENFDNFLADHNSDDQPNNTQYPQGTAGLFTYPDAQDLPDNTSSTKKRRSASVNKEATYHIVGFEESLADIARMYDLDENSIRIRNRIPKDGLVHPGEKIYLRKKIRLTNRPDYTREINQESIAANNTFIF